MKKNRLLTILKQVEKKELSPEEALKEFQEYSFTDLGFAKVDHLREEKKGFPEDRKSVV